jgi:demethylmenaquinone methyltransferase/2-methoxy-6-polyprenyl-1,4-benzoquinol methylase
MRQALSVAEIDDAVRAQREYYDQRAPEYEDSYQRTRGYDRGTPANAAWRAAMADLGDAFDRVPLDGDILELAAGTGAWTERIVGRARSLAVVDASTAMLDANRARLGSAAASVDYRIADLFDWRPERRWDACVFGFWLCKVPDNRIADFLGAVTDALRAGGAVCCVDKAAVAEPATELEERTLNDGRRFTIVDHPRPPARLVEVFATAGLAVELNTIGNRFCLAQGTRAG